MIYTHATCTLHTGPGTIHWGKERDGTPSEGLLGLVLYGKIVPMYRTTTNNNSSSATTTNNSSTTTTTNNNDSSTTTANNSSSTTTTTNNNESPK